MSHAGTKPRWEAWEKKCIKLAFQQNIQLKIMALGLGRTLTSINKKIRSLGLRPYSAKRGRAKGSGYSLSLMEKVRNDREMMKKILVECAPWRFSQQRLLPSSVEFIKSEKASYIYSYPLDYILSTDPIIKKDKKVKTYELACYVSLHHVEAWATTQGFHALGSPMKQHGLSYWKDGKYFSSAQLLIYLNRIRLERRLQPLILWEDDY